MIFLVFLNLYDQNSHLMGRSLPDYLKGDYVKICTRYPNSKYEECKVKDTLLKIREYAQVFDKVIVSFGLRLFPASTYKDLIKENYNTKESLVFLKQLRGSKTWSIKEGRLSFDNNRIADMGLFILRSEDVLTSRTDNFNELIRLLVAKDKLSYKFVKQWVMTNRMKGFKKEKI